ncbi:hypothetical protein DY000_02017014 [Brassica cretica]|uniref:Uncharacterized protein n=1 Tax=Brassica cretica TaxID=69181 RepID=A0ABQ7CT31_BRACR|nr:hypothetical protein DY000_02017014 [Brassica cretica]
MGASKPKNMAPTTSEKPNCCRPNQESKHEPTKNIGKGRHRRYEEKLSTDDDVIKKKNQRLPPLARTTVTIYTHLAGRPVVGKSGNCESHF